MAREPGYCRHKATNQAYIRLGGQVIYLGEYGSEKSRERYRSLKAEWLSNRGAFEAKARARRAELVGPTMAHLANAYLDHAERYYGRTTEYANLKLACGPLSDLYSHRPTSQFCPVAFRVCRDWWLKDPKRSRQYINKMMRYLLRILKWGCSEGLVPPAVYESCRCVAPLKRGRTEAPESKPVLPVADHIVDATVKHCTEVVADMVRFQRLVGCRPGELVRIKPSMVNRSGEVWTITLADHKTAHHGKDRVIYVGPRAQAILKRYLLRDADKPCFSPIESERQRLAARHEKRVTPPSCGNRPGTNRIARKPRKAPGEAFTTGTYARSIRSACVRAKVAPWSPNQLRHSAATAIRAKFGLEHAQVILGHSELGVT
nr:tyrosine-type recombinase/integrase [Pirellula sp.]